MMTSQQISFTKFTRIQFVVQGSRQYTSIYVFLQLLFFYYNAFFRTVHKYLVHPGQTAQRPDGDNPTRLRTVWLRSPSNRDFPPGRERTYFLVLLICEAFI